MSQKCPDTVTYHAMLVAWGQFAQSIGLVRAVETVILPQKKRVHSPQTKILEFLIAILAGLKHLQELSRSAHPIDQDQAVAKAYDQRARRQGVCQLGGEFRVCNGHTPARLNHAQRGVNQGRIIVYRME